jgi:hypothetical protein
MFVCFVLPWAIPIKSMLICISICRAPEQKLSRTCRLASSRRDIQDLQRNQRGGANRCPPEERGFGLSWAVGYG